MRKCRTCGTELSKRSNFCPICRIELTSYQIQKTPVWLDKLVDILLWPPGFGLIAGWVVITAIFGIVGIIVSLASQSIWTFMIFLVLYAALICLVIVAHRKRKSQGRT